MLPALKLGTKTMDNLLSLAEHCDRPKDIQRANDEIALRNQTQSPLLRLPAELRMQVYEHALSGWSIRLYFPYCQANPFKVVLAIHGPTNRAKETRKTSNKHFLALLYVCSQINAETRGLPFTLNNEFRLARVYDIARFGDWLTPAQRPLIRNVRISVSLLEWDMIEVHSNHMGDRRPPPREVLLAVLENVECLRSVVLEADPQHVSHWEPICVALTQALSREERLKDRKKIEVTIVRRGEK